MTDFKDIKEERLAGFGDCQLGPQFQQGQPLRWRRTTAGLATNVFWQVRHHSPDGLEIGYSGSGPADLALNAMAALFPSQSLDGFECVSGFVSHQAWALHQEFKEHFLAGADRNLGRIEWAEIEAWLVKELAATAQPAKPVPFSKESIQYHDRLMDSED